MKPNLEDMQVFLDVVEARSFTLASEKLGRTKSAISQSVTRLENDLGVRLLYRSTRSLSLTEQGAQFLSRCQDIRQTYEQALTEINAQPGGLLTITAPHALCQPLVTPAIARFKTLNENINVRLIASDSPMNLVENQIDLAIRVGKTDWQSAKISKLGTLKESLYVSKDYIQRRGGLPDDLAEIADWTHLANDWQGIPVRYRLSKSAEISVRPVIRCSSLHDLMQLTVQGTGVARMPDISVEELVSNRALQKIAFVSEEPIHYMHLFSNRPPEKVKRFVKLLKEQFKRE